MANTSNNSARQTHVSPGIYTKETELNYAAKSLGITTLGVVGETVKGPAFQRISIENWRQYQQFFGGTNTEKFRGSQYPKYELPYIAQSYLKQSNQLEVVRVLGLSGVNAGPAWVITADKEGASEDSPYHNMVVCVLRSRGEHKKAVFKEEADPSQQKCNDVYDYDSIEYYATSVALTPSNILNYSSDCEPTPSASAENFKVNVNNYGRFTIKVNGDSGKSYSVSFNPDEKNYITKVLGTDPEVGEALVYVEEMYDVALEQLIESGDITEINQTPVFYDYAYIVPKFDEVDDILTEEEKMLKRKDIGKRFLFTSESKKGDDSGNLTVHVSTDQGASWTPQEGTIGHIYTVVPFTESDGTRHYYYGEYNSSGDVDDKWKPQVLSAPTVTDHEVEDVVKCKADGSFYIYKDGDAVPVTFDMNNYREQYRCAVTPWVVSEMKGDALNVELNRLFRFYTISDGNSANTEVKVSIENISPENGTFDVLVRAFYDTDDAPVIYERFGGVNLIPGDQNYIAFRIGSYDEEYITKSNYITVEVNENEKTMTSIPCGFMGYPVDITKMEYRLLLRPVAL